MNSLFTRQTITDAWHSIKSTSPVLAWGTVLMLLASFITLGLPFVDSRLFQGISVWHKPWKFQISIAIYWVTLVYFMRYLPNSSKPTLAWRYLVWVSMIGGLFEVVYITWQGALGQASHYNVGSAFHATMYTAMGVAAVLLTTTAGVLGYQILRQPAVQKFISISMQQAIGIGLLISSILGIITGAILGERTRSGGHWVGGTANDSLGLWMLNWSRDGGDLRVAHFFALHAMQILPLMLCMAYYVAPSLRSAPSVPATQRLVWLAALLYVGFCLFTLLQALSGKAFL